MFIELTDHLRCGVDHPESYLVLLPDRMEGRRVAAGTLGCPVCSRVVSVVDGVLDFGGEAPVATTTALTAEAVAAFLGLEGPGGYLALLGGVARLAPALAELLPGIHLVAVNPPSDLARHDRVSVVRGGRSPIKAHSMRGVVVGEDHGAMATWVEQALGAVLPGNRAVVAGPERQLPNVELLVAAPGVWVGRIRSKR